MRFQILLFATAIFLSSSGPLFAEEIIGSVQSNDSLKFPPAKNNLPGDSNTVSVDSSADSVHLSDTMVLAADSINDTKDSSRTVDSAEALLTDSAAITDTTLIDTSFRVWNYPYWSFGFGWALGSMPVFDTWRSGLPYALTEIPELADTLDSLNLTLTVNNDPGTYAVNFPICVSFTRLIEENKSFSIKAIFSWMRKSFEAFAKPDIGETYWDTKRSLSISSISLGFFYNYSVPSKFFLINNTERTSFTLGISGAPLIYLRNKVKTLDKTVLYISAYGTGVSWYIGVTTLRKLSEANGLEIGILYYGSWNQRFIHEGSTERHHIKNSDINPLSKNPSEVVQFLSQRFILSLNILTGKKEYRTKTK